MIRPIAVGSASATTRSRSREKDSWEHMERTPHRIYLSRQCNETPAFNESRAGNGDVENSFAHESRRVCLRRGDSGILTSTLRYFVYLPSRNWLKSPQRLPARRTVRSSDRPSRIRGIPPQSADLVERRELPTRSAINFRCRSSHPDLSCLRTGVESPTPATRALPWRRQHSAEQRCLPVNNFRAVAAIDYLNRDRLVLSFKRNNALGTSPS